MDINVYLFIVIALMLLIIMYLLFVLRRVRTQLALIKDALDDIKGGNLNRRILAGENDMTKTICYILPVCVTLVYTFLSFILLMVNMYLHPLSSATAIIMRDIPGVILAQEVNIPAALFCIGIWTIVSIVFAYISLKHRK